MKSERVYDAARRGLLLFDPRQNRRTAVIAWIALIAMCIIVYRFVSNHDTATTASGDTVRAVQLATIRSLSSGDSSLSIVGTVTSEGQATVHAEKGGQVVALYHKIGDSVSAGDVIALLEHDSESAAVQQAQASVAAAQANLAKVTGGVRSEQKIILQSSAADAQSSLASTQQSAVASIMSSYQSIQSAVTAVADGMIANPTSVNPSFTILTSNSQAANDVTSKRLALQQIISQEQTKQHTISTTDDLTADITSTEQDLHTTISLLDSIVSALNAAVPSAQVPSATIASDLAAVTAARAQLTAALSTLSDVQDALNGKGTALVAAQQSLAQGVTGGQPEDVAAAQAGLEQAQAGLAAANAAYEHAVIRAPISGSITMLAMKNGDYVSAGSSVVTVSNDNGLEVVAYVGNNDLRSITVGTQADLGSDASGTVTHMATVVDPNSKQAEVDIGVTKLGTLVNGQSTVVSFIRADAPQATTSALMIVPLSAIKVGSDHMSVFTLSASSTLVEHRVSLGTLLGDKVVLTDGVTPDMSIVTDARGLRDGEKVITQ